ncbi:MAG: sulfite exporter TauE/SafE family protein [Campylobacterota bacterium]|nr:sulfite exporter TauE/SafE family protein [Campylobacterota bacterium]
MADYGLYFLITLVLSTFFAMGGVGSAVALLPMLDMLGIPLNLAKATALFVNTSTTLTATFMNFKRGVLELRFALPLVVSSLVTAPLGVAASRYVDDDTVRFILMIFLIISASLILFSNKKAVLVYKARWVMYAVGAVVGFISGVLGIGGGSLVMPIMILLGFDVKKMAVAVSFMVSLVTLSAFISYATFVQIDMLLLLFCGSAAVLGGYLGNHIMHYKLSSHHIKKIIGVILYVLAFKIGVDLI